MKKKLLIASLICFLIAGFAGLGICADGDIDKVEVRADVAAWSLDTIKLLRYTETAVITYRKVDAEGNSLGEEFDVIFTNVAENEETPEIELSTDFSDFYAYLHTRILAGDSLKTAVTKSCKIKLGL